MRRMPIKHRAKKLGYWAISGIILTTDSCIHQRKTLCSDRMVNDQTLLGAKWNGDPQIAGALSHLYSLHEDEVGEFIWARCAGESYESMSGIEKWIDCIKGSDELPVELQEILYGGVASNEKEAIETILKKASLKFAMASWLLGDYYEEGLLLKNANLSGNECEYERIITTDPDYGKAISAYEDAANRGIVNAWFSLPMLISMQDTEINRIKSLFWMAMFHAMSDGDLDHYVTLFAEAYRARLTEEARRNVEMKVWQKIDEIYDNHHKGVQAYLEIIRPFRDRDQAKKRASAACGF